MMDFQAINQRAISCLPDLLPSKLPGGRVKGREFVCGDLAGNPGESLAINLDSGKWSDFATDDKGGDVISLVAAVHGISQVDAARYLTDWMGTTTRTTTRKASTIDTWKPTPTATPPKSIIHPKMGKPSVTFEYRDPDEKIIGYDCRFDPPVSGPKKQVLPFTPCINTATGKTDFRWKSPTTPRPLYGLDRLAQRPGAPVLFCEGCKATDAAQRQLSSVVVVTWQGGSGAVDKADLTPIAGRRVAIWPDNDEPGRKAAETLAQRCLKAGAVEVYIIEPPSGKAEGWDLADAEAEGWIPDQVSEWIRKNKRLAVAARELAGVAPKGKSEEWPDPLPLTTHQQADPYPLNALPGIIGEAVKEVVDFVQCPVALGACSALGVVSTVGQGLVDVRRADKLEGPASIFPFAIAPSGERKTTVDGFFSKPVKQWEAEQAEAAKPDLQKFAAEIATWEAKRNGLLANISAESKKGNSTDKQALQMLKLEAEKPQPPKIPRLLFSDATPEALAYSLANNWPVGGVLSSEAGIVFGGHAMGKDSAMRNMAMLNSFWDAEPLRIDRRSGPSYTVRGVRLTMSLAVQAETIKSFLDSSKGLARGIGFLARFLVAWPESTQGCRMFQDPPDHWPQLAKFNRRLGTLLDSPLAFNENGELAPVMLELSPDAKKVWVAFHDDVEAELSPGRDMEETKDVASKAADNAARLAALFHLFENGIEGAIGPDHMKSAAAVAGWHLYEARRFMGEIALDAGVSNAVKLDAWLTGYCKQNKVVAVSTRDIQREGPNCTRAKAILDVALEELTESGRVRVVKDKQRKNVEINPALLEG